MSVKFKIGTPVKQVVKAVEGTVQAVQVIDGEVHYEVHWIDVIGHDQSRTFAEDQIEAVA